MFRKKEDMLSRKSTQYKKDWLQTVRLARKLYSNNTTQDKFDTYPTLREWVGLPKLVNTKKKKKKGTNNKKKQILLKL